MASSQKQAVAEMQDSNQLPTQGVTRTSLAGPSANSDAMSHVPDSSAHRVSAIVVEREVAGVMTEITVYIAWRVRISQDEAEYETEVLGVDSEWSRIFGLSDLTRDELAAAEDDAVEFARRVLR